MTSLRARSVAAGAALAVVCGCSGSSGPTASTAPPTSGSAKAVVTLQPAGSVDSAGRAELVKRLSARLSSAGISGTVQDSGSSLILRLPAADVRAVAELTALGELTFRPVDSAANAPKASTTAGAASSTSGPNHAASLTPALQANLGQLDCSTPGVLTGHTTEWVSACDRSLPVKYVLKPAALTGRAVRSARATIQTGANGTSTGQWIVAISFTSASQRAFADLTALISSSGGCPASAAPSCSLAIVLDGVVESAPIIEARIPGDAYISGSYDEKAAKLLAAVINGGSLPTPLRIRSVTEPH